jgi:imidazolonepropionase-like amidohydrolase
MERGMCPRSCEENRLQILQRNLVITRRSLQAKQLLLERRFKTHLAKQYKAGVKIAFGTDAGVYAHGKNWKEFVYMTEAGMPILEAIRAATLSASQLLGVDNIGTIEKISLQDIIAVDVDPTKDVNAMGNEKVLYEGWCEYKSE